MFLITRLGHREVTVRATHLAARRLNQGRFFWPGVRHGSEVELDLDDGAVPIDNNWCENQIRPWALGRSNWLFAGSLRSGKRAAAIMSLIQSARLNGHDPYAYLKDVLTRLPTQRASEIAELLPHRWRPV
ncbi:transposase domain-containing protein [Pseudomonas tritici]|uniref:transposase domain-containing protein n=1 Tax=Pseudomonas tritici TaxID=2745518 RepID=UPI003F59C0EA